ncbi:MAG: SH3 domain-containing protein [Cyanothece sp. SIO1E1]|nr:SH3 domain-containing protein [Cyanothece sp. SIO1E1]
MLSPKAQAITGAVQAAALESGSRPNRSDNPIAQINNFASCGLVFTGGRDLALNVHTRPDGRVISSLPEGTRVEIVDQRVRGWVGISAPANGFVRSSFLRPCQFNGQPINSGQRFSACRRVFTGNRAFSLNVHDSPDGRVTNSLPDGTEVVITSQGARGWVPIDRPASGFVRSDFLKFCQ